MSSALPSSLTRGQKELILRELKLFTPKEVADLFEVDPKTVTRWAKAGKIKAMRTLGGHRRYREDEVKRLYEEADGVWPF